MRDSLTKSQRKRLGALAALAYDRDLSAELSKLEKGFVRWRDTQMTPQDLSAMIHEFHNGAARRLFIWYDRGDSVLAVASAIARGVLSEREVASDLAPHLTRFVAYFREEAGLTSGRERPVAPEE